MTVEKRVFSLGRFTKDPQVINFYTGFKDFQTLKWLYVALQPTAATMTRYKDTNANLRHSIKRTKSLMLFLMNHCRSWINSLCFFEE